MSLNTGITWPNETKKKVIIWYVCICIISLSSKAFLKGWDLALYILFTYSCKELINTLEVYSNSNDVFDRPNASLFGLLKAKAVPSEDLLLAPMSENRNYQCKELIFFLDFFANEMKIRKKTTRY